ncbi:MAG: hypothetical protein K8J08_07665, partial [Thermoanaerobaculia bacterium]|nr:hypothetical protein [Thermoanaerobaculia bacterium]
MGSPRLRSIVTGAPEDLGLVGGWIGEALGAQFPRRESDCYSGAPMLIFPSCPRSWYRCRSLATSMALVLLFATSAVADVEGVIVDRQGQPIAGAKVTTASDDVA